MVGIWTNVKLNFCIQTLKINSQNGITLSSNSQRSLSSISSRQWCLFWTKRYFEKTYLWLWIVSWVYRPVKKENWRVQGVYKDRFDSKVNKRKRPNTSIKDDLCQQI